MRVGLLECDHVSERFRHLSGDYADMFGALFGDLELQPFDVCNGQVPASPRECDAWVCSGSRRSVYDDDAWIEPAARFVREVHDAEVPFVGICFGHQLLAHALGGTVEKSAYGWGVGIHPVRVLRPEPWMRPAQERLNLHFMHQDQVTRAPDEAVVMGCTDHCEVAMFGVGDVMVGIQAHPEFTVPYADALLGDRTERVGGDRAEEARRSLATATDEAVVASWLTSFLSRAVEEAR
jgi:GMP synthase-like glutamine amidotransferase